MNHSDKITYGIIMSYLIISSLIVSFSNYGHKHLFFGITGISTILTIIWLEIRNKQKD